MIMKERRDEMPVSEFKGLALDIRSFRGIELKNSVGVDRGCHIFFIVTFAEETFDNVQRRPINLTVKEKGRINPAGIS